MIEQRTKFALTLLLLLQMGAFVLGPSICRAVMASSLYASSQTCCPTIPESAASSKPADSEDSSQKSCPLHELARLAATAPKASFSCSVFAPTFQKHFDCYAILIAARRLGKFEKLITSRPPFPRFDPALQRLTDILRV